MKTQKYNCTTCKILYCKRDESGFYCCMDCAYFEPTYACPKKRSNWFFRFLDRFRDKGCRKFKEIGEEKGHEKG